MGSDGRVDSRFGGRKAGASGFRWVSSSPTPAEVASLEAAYPEVVRIPVAELELELGGWQSSAVIARSFQRWVPAAALIREFRRAGIQGEIVPVSLAFRCHVFRFEDPSACELVLNRPWVVNGQLVGTERWKPEFFPAENAVSSVLLWVRLPNLPLEYWKEEFISAILEPAGQFVSLDAATVARSRGGFARACLRVDLCRPLRPGARVQGGGAPFWQPIVYECLEGICPGCGTLHLEGPCAKVASGSAEGDEGSPVFGPWIAAVRQWCPGSGSASGGSGRAQPQSSRGAGGSGSELQSQSSNPGTGVRVEEGWQVPRKVARRRGVAAETVAEGPCMGSDVGVGSEEKGSLEASGAPGSSGRANSVRPVKSLFMPVNGKNREHIQKLPLRNQNPFSSIAMELGEARPKEIRDAYPGSLKRARPVVSQAPRILPMVDKRKGKGKVPQTKSSGVFIFSSGNLNPSSLDSEGELERRVPCSEREDDSSMVVAGGDMPGTSSGPLSAVQSPRVNTDLEGMEEGLAVIEEDGTLSIGCISDTAMMEDQGVALASSSM